MCENSTLEVHTIIQELNDCSHIKWHKREQLIGIKYTMILK